MTVSFSPQNYTVPEGIPATLEMALDKKASESITVFVTTMDITAGSADYVQKTSTPVKFAPGTTRAVLPLLTLRDTVINEPDVSLKVTLDLGPTTVPVEIGPDPCFVTIEDATSESEYIMQMSAEICTSLCLLHLIVDFANGSCMQHLST